jgi:hypothetical protein
MESLSDDQRDALSAIVKWHGDGGQEPLILGGLAGTGKALADGTLIPGPDGARPIEDLRPGDQVFGADGQAAKVIGVYPQGVRDLYRMTFRDGTSIACDGEHRWAVSMRSHGKPKTFTRTTLELLAHGLRNNAGCKFQVPLSSPLQYPPQDLPVDPYVLGVLLGNGTDLGRTPTLCNNAERPQIAEEMIRRLPSWTAVSTDQPVASVKRYRITDPAQMAEGRDVHFRNRFAVLFEQLGLARGRQGLKSPERFIPAVYLQAPEPERWLLLQGLMDTDGSCVRNRTTFSSESPWLISGIVELVQSLGGTAIVRASGTEVNIKTFRCPFLCRESVWALSRKNPPSRAITAIEPCGRGPATCIMVDALDHLFVAEHSIVTHNTRLAGLLPAVLPRARIAYAAYTGKAVSVLRAALPAGSERVSTLHRLLYSPCVMSLCAASEQPLPAKAVRCPAHGRQEAPCPVRQQVSFTPVADPLEELDLVVADEASMIPERIWADLTSHGVPVLAVGDHGQLPPVQSAFNLMAAPDLRLEEIHRQNAEHPSGMAILNMARWAREQGHVPHGPYGPDVMKIRPHDIGHAGLHPAEADMIICATNATRAWHNTAMRSWFGRSGQPQAGDVVICLRNNYDEGLFNGQRGTIRETGRSLAIDGEPAWQMSIELDGLDDPWEGAVAAAPFGQPPATASAIRSRDLALFDFGYALTCHRAQGSTVSRVLVIEEGWPAPGTELRQRWLYTAVTRASQALTVAGW